MTQQIWTEFDRYTTDLLIPEAKELEFVLAANNESGLPAHDVSATQGKFLNFMIKLTGANHVLEIGTLGGYSTIWMARALGEHGKLVTLEANPINAEVARKNIEQADLAEQVEIRIGAALDSLAALKAEGYPSFDIVFIDADKPNNPIYLKWAMELTRDGGLIIADNVVRKGEVCNSDSTDPNVKGIRQFNELIAKEKSLSATTIQTVGDKGYDGFSLIHVLKNRK